LPQEHATDSALMRSRVYGLLRRIFSREVGEALLAWCREQHGLGLWSALDLAVGEALGAANSEAALEDLALDFCRLFITSGSAGSPHESVQVESRREKGGPILLWGDPASEVKDLYREAGLELDAEAHQLPDALAVELEFMERVGQEEAAARREGRSDEVRRFRDLQHRMLTEHLRQWVPEYGRRLGAEARTDFYRTMLNLAADLVEWDAATE
jgi:TorA maturation chaperone TorD